jgi:hypothetical protein
MSQDNDQGTKRDFVLARLAVATNVLAGLREDVDAIVSEMIDPSGDGDGARRMEALENCEIGCHSLLSELQAAKAELAEMSDEELSEEEPEFEVDDDDESDEGEEGEPPEDTD